MAMVKIPWEGWELAGEVPIGKGGFGEVYEIRRNMYGLEEHAAMKVLRIPKDERDLDALRFEGMDDDSIARTYHGYVSDVIKEYETMQKLGNSPHVVHVYDLEVRRDKDRLLWTVYIRMELLTPIMRMPACIREEGQILKLAKDICSALTDCHRKNILHRDIKPENIFIDAEGNYKIGDFDISRIVDHTTQASVGVGTYDYMAPEVVNGNSYGLQADIYSLGMVLYYLLNERRHPFVPMPPAIPTYEEKMEARNRKWRGEPIPPPKNGCDGLRRIVMKASAFQTKSRYFTAQNMLDELNGITREEDSVTRRGKKRPPRHVPPAVTADTPEQGTDGEKTVRDEKPPEVPEKKPKEPLDKVPETEPEKNPGKQRWKSLWWQSVLKSVRNIAVYAAVIFLVMLAVTVIQRFLR